MKIGLFQCELEHLHQAPHLAGCLFASDLRALGHEVRQAMVHPSELAAWVRYLSEESIDLAICDAIFPFPLLRAAQAAEVPLMVGGHNALQHILRGPADLAVVGVGREAIRVLGRALHLLPQHPQAILEEGKGGRRCLSQQALRALEEVPNLWFWRRRDSGEPLLDCTAHTASGSPASEASPYQPDLPQEYFGPARRAQDDFYIPSVVAELGCLYSAPPRRSSALKDLPPRMPEGPISERGRERINRDILELAGGCSFCVFRTLPNARESRASSISLVVDQLATLEKLGGQGASLQTENPIPLLLPLLQELERRGLRPNPLHIRTIPWLLLKQEAQLRSAVEKARDLGIHIHLTQVGFETFHGPDLDLFNKGISADENLRAAALLRDLDAELRPHLRGIFGHGLILLHPWTSLEGLRSNLRAVQGDASFMREDISPASKLAFYSEVIPLFWKAHAEGLVTPTDDEFGWRWSFADRKVEVVVGIWAEALTELRQRWDEGAARLLARTPSNRASLQAVLERQRLKLELRGRLEVLEKLLQLAELEPFEPVRLRQGARQVCDRLLG